MLASIKERNDFFFLNYRYRCSLAEIIGPTHKRTSLLYFTLPRIRKSRNKNRFVSEKKRKETDILKSEITLKLFDSFSLNINRKEKRIRMVIYFEKNFHLKKFYSFDQLVLKCRPLIQKVRFLSYMLLL